MIAAGIIDKEEELQPIFERNQYNPAMRRVMMQFADSKGWKQINLFTNEKDIRELSGKFFEYAKQGAKVPNGYGGLYVQDDHSLIDLLRAYGLTYMSAID